MRRCVAWPIASKGPKGGVSPSWGQNSPQESNCWRGSNEPWCCCFQPRDIASALTVFVLHGGLCCPGVASALFLRWFVEEP